MSTLTAPEPLTKKYITPGVIILAVLALNGVAFVLARLLFGIGAVTNLSDQYPWGLWIGVDVAAGVALAAGGFTSAALGHVMHREDYHAIVRPALLTAMLGYTFVAFGVMIDIGRWYYIWHPLLMWNGNSALFEVGICVIIYISVLYIEFLPIVTERFMGRVQLKGIFSILNRPLESLLRTLDRTLSKTMFLFIIAGPKMHPLWQTPVLPLLFLLSAVAVGFPMVIFEALLASRSFGLKPEMHILSKLGTMVAPLLGIYLAFKLGDMVIRETFVYLAEPTTASVMFMIEIVVGVIIPLRMFLSRTVVRSPLWLFVASTLVILGVLLNRINNFIVAYTPPYATAGYFPSVGEISVTVGFVALLVLVYRFLVKVFPIISVEQRPISPTTKYSIRGTAK